MVLETKHYLIHFEPPLEISKKIENLNKIVSAKYENKYNSLVEGVWRSHLMVYLSPMPSENEKGILDVAERVSGTLEPFEVTLEGFSKGTDGYIFVDVDRGTQEKLSEIREKLVEGLLSYRDSSIKQKYLDRWDEFSEEEKRRIKKTGIPYEYKAHFTIAQVDKKDMNGAIKLLEDKTLRGYSFLVDGLQVLSLYNGFNEIAAKYYFGNK